MLRLFKIEMHKIVRYIPFWVMIGLYFMFLVFLSLVFESASEGFVEGLNNGQKAELNLSYLTNFPAIWVLFANLAFLFKFLIAIVLVLIVCNEYQYGTLKQNFIDGLSRTEIMAGKELVIVFLSIICTILVVVLTLVVGNKTPEAGIMSGSYTVLLYLLAMLFYFNIVYFLSTLIMRTGITILILIIYGFVEKIINLIYKPIADFLPYHTLDSIIPNLTPIFNNQDVEFSIKPVNIIMAIVYLALAVLGNYWILKKRHLK